MEPFCFFIFSKDVKAKKELAFFCFIAAHKKTILSEHPDWSMDEITQELSKKWTVLTPEEMMVCFHDDL